MAYFDLMKIKKATKLIFCGFFKGLGTPFSRGSRMPFLSHKHQWISYL